MSKEKLNILIDKVIGKDGPFRVPSYWMNKVLNDIVEWIGSTDSKINRVNSKVDETKASIPTKVSQLENDASFTGYEYLPVKEQYFGNTVVLENGVIKSIVCPYQEIKLSILEDSPFYEGYLMFNSPKSGVNFQGISDSVESIKTTLGKFILKVTKLSEDGDILAEVHRIGEVDVAYVKYARSERWNGFKTTAYIGRITGEIIASNIIQNVNVDNYGRIILHEYKSLEAGDVIEVLYKGTAQVLGYYGNATSNGFAVDITHIGSDIGHISFTEYNTAKHSLFTDSDIGFSAKTTQYMRAVEYMEGVTNIINGCDERVVIPSTARSISVSPKILVFKDQDTISRVADQLYGYSQYTKSSIVIGDDDSPATVYIPPSMTYISPNFLTDFQIQNVFIHAGVTFIGKWFLNGSSVDNLYIPYPEKSNRFVSKDYTNIEIIKGVYYTDGDNGLSGDKSDSWYENGEVIRVAREGAKKWDGSRLGTLTKIRESAFSSISRLITITIPDTITEIGKFAFSACSGLTDLSILGQLSEIPENMCGNCYALINFSCKTVGNKIGAHAFSNCRELKNVNITDGCNVISTYAFKDCHNLQELHIPRSCTSIADNAFSGCKPESITVAEDNTIYDSRNSCNAIIITSDNAILLGGINTIIPDSVTTIKSYAFTSGGISKLVIPENVSLIDYRAFYSLSTPSGLDGEVIVNGIPNIGNQAFYNVTPSVLQFTSEDGIPALLGSFSYFKGEGKIVVPDSLYDAWITSTNWSKYADQIIKKSDWDAQQTE